MIKKQNKKNKQPKPETKKFYDKVLRSGGLTNWVTGKGARRVATAMIYERVGQSEVFVGGYPLLKGTFNIGEYCVLDYKKPIFMDVPSSEMFTLCKDRKLDKIIEFVKEAEDVFRPRSKLDNTFYKKVEQPVYETQELIEEGERVVDEDGDPYMIKVHKTDKDGNKMYKNIESKYIEPMGVTQSGRDAIRIHNNTNEEIKKFKEKGEGFWSKFARSGGLGVVSLAIVGMILIMGIKIQSDAWGDGVRELSGEMHDANQNMKWWQQPDALDKITEGVQMKQDEKNAPPVK